MMIDKETGMVIKDGLKDKIAELTADELKEVNDKTKPMKVLLLYPPFCTPTIMPYSISNLKGFLSANSDFNIKAIDLNGKFHSTMFSSYYEEVKDLRKQRKCGDIDQSDFIEKYGDILTRFHEESKTVYSKANKEVVDGGKPPLFEEMLQMILSEAPDVVALSLVYSSQNFYATALIDELNSRGIRCVVGGPAVSERVKGKAKFIPHEVALLEDLGRKMEMTSEPDFSDFSAKDYLTVDKIYPIKTSTSCVYRQCTFCTHHESGEYFELDVPELEKDSYVFFIDSMIPTKRLMTIAQKMKEFKIKWSTQLRPTRDLIPHLEELAASGLVSVAWGVESGCQEILKKMRKGTVARDVAEVLKEAKRVGIINMAYVMFGFPSETREQFLETIKFLEDNSKNIDLVSTSTFGLQKGSYVYQNPLEFGIKTIREVKRTVLDEKIEFETVSGMNNEELRKIKKGHSKTIQKINKLPKIFNYMKEQTLFF